MTDNKVMPSAVDMEIAVLGAILLEEDAFNIVRGMLTRDMFYVDMHQYIWDACVNLYKASTAIDLLTVFNELKKMGRTSEAFGYLQLSALTSEIGSSAHIEAHAQVIVQYWLYRQLIKLSTETTNHAFSQELDVFELISEVEAKIARLKNGITITSLIPQSEQFEAAIGKIINPDVNSAIPSKHHAINIHMGGYPRGCLIVIGGRPGMGKSAFVVSETLYGIEQGYRDAIFSLEMTDKQMNTRLIANLSGVQNFVLRNRSWDGMQWAKVEGCIMTLRSYVQDGNVYIDYRGDIDVMTIWFAVKALKKRKGGVDRVIIDFLQRVKTKDKTTNRDQEIGVICGTLKAMAKAEDVSVILLSSMSRENEKTADKRPSLTSLRESGNIESDADVVLFLFRPEYYFKKDRDGNTIYEDDLQRSMRAKVSIIAEKNRDGNTFEDMVNCSLGTSNFFDDVPVSSEPPQQYKKITPRIDKKDKIEDAPPF